VKSTIINVKVYSQFGVLDPGVVSFENGKITEVCHFQQGMKFDEHQQIIELSPDYVLVPGMIDLHIHGAGGFDVMDATQEAITAIGTQLPKEGTTSFLATTMTQSEEAITNSLTNVTQYIKAMNTPGKAEVLGVHLEGPFINPKRAGAQSVEHIIPPDVEKFKEWQRITENQIRLVTLAPELDFKYQLTRYLRDTGVIASIGHSDATYEEAAKSFQEGVTHATHLFNGMRGLHHREPGLIGAVLLNDCVMAEVIADGVHVRPEMLQLAYRQKGKDGIILVTDAMRAKCLGEGIYDLGGQMVTVECNRAVLQNGTLAGSILTMREAAMNMMNYTNCGLEDLICMSALNAARQLKLEQRKGSIAVGKDADLVVLSKNLEVIMTICRGQIAV
jgi:N-acetylglucosamine-6-phosphate deacetylase